MQHLTGMQYQPGLHILATISTQKIGLLEKSAPMKIFFDDLIQHLSLEKVGEVYHDFEGGGFTGVVCLTESHLSIHTWPEYQLATFDVFLSNFRQNNHEKVRTIYAALVKFWEATEISFNEIER